MVINVKECFHDAYKRYVEKEEKKAKLWDSLGLKKQLDIIIHAVEKALD